MTSEEALQEKLPLIAAILLSNEIVPGQYSVSTYLKEDGEYGCGVSPTSGNSPFFTTKVQDDLTAAGFVVRVLTS